VFRSRVRCGSALSRLECGTRILVGQDVVRSSGEHPSPDTPRDRRSPIRRNSVHMDKDHGG
jgi:hypothetical protein